MPVDKAARKAYTAGQQKPVMFIPATPIPLAANEILALVVFGTLSERFFLIPLIAESIADCREFTTHQVVWIIRFIVRRYEQSMLIGVPAGIVQRVELFLTSLAEKFPFDDGAWVINAFKEILTKWEKMVKKTFPKK